MLKPKLEQPLSDSANDIVQAFRVSIRGAELLEQRSSKPKRRVLREIKYTCISPFNGRATPLAFTDEIEVLSRGKPPSKILTTG
jgi:hypothetical protein